MNGAPMWDEVGLLLEIISVDPLEVQSLDLTKLKGKQIQIQTFLHIFFSFSLPGLNKNKNRQVELLLLPRNFGV